LKLAARSSSTYQIMTRIFHRSHWVMMTFRCLAHKGYCLHHVY
jgi:hypothetical protein